MLYHRSLYMKDLVKELYDIRVVWDVLTFIFGFENHKDEENNPILITYQAAETLAMNVFLWSNDLHQLKQQHTEAYQTGLRMIVHLCQTDINEKTTDYLFQSIRALLVSRNREYAPGLWPFV